MGAQAFLILPCLLGLPYYNLVGYITHVVFYTHPDTRTNPDITGYRMILVYIPYMTTYLPTDPATCLPS